MFGGGGGEGVTTDEKGVFIQIQNTMVSSKALVLVNCVNTFVHDRGLNCGAILLTCCGLKCAVFKRKFHHFETVNRKNNLYEALDIKMGGNWRVPGKGIVPCLTVLDQDGRLKRGH